MLANVQAPDLVLIRCPHPNSRVDQPEDEIRRREHEGESGDYADHLCSELTDSTSEEEAIDPTVPCLCEQPNRQGPPCAGKTVNAYCAYRIIDLEQPFEQDLNARPRAMKLGRQCFNAVAHMLQRWVEEVTRRFHARDKRLFANICATTRSRTQSSRRMLSMSRAGPT